MTTAKENENQLKQIILKQKQNKNGKWRSSSQKEAFT